MDITSEQVKAARLLLGWSQTKLAAESGVCAASIATFEDHNQLPPMLDLGVVQRMLNDAGIEFGEGELGVRLRESPAIPEQPGSDRP